jgi:tight adherence protein B
MSTFLVIGSGSALILLIAGLVVTLRGQRSLIDERLDEYLDESEEELQDMADSASDPGFFTSWINNQVEKTSFGDRMARELARADLKLKTGEYVALMVISSLFLAVFAYFFGGGSLIFALAGILFGPFIPRFYLRFQQKARLRTFNDQLPDMLNLMVNGLRTGFSSLQAMEVVATELPEPISEEFRRVVQEIQLGVPMGLALENLQRRIPSDDLDLAVTAINIQREVGGNLAEILDTISYTIRERVRIKGEVRAITSQMTYSGRFLSLLPIFLGFALWGLNRDYIGQFFLEPRTCGIAMLTLAGVMLIFGYAALNRLSDIEI